MNKILFKITAIYHIKDYDWMNFYICKDNPLTYHHILEKRNGGKKTIKNGAPLTKDAHSYLNMIEVKDKRLYIALNTLFELVQTQHSPITINQKKMINEVLNYFELNLDNYKNSKNNNRQLLKKYTKHKNNVKD